MAHDNEERHRKNRHSARGKWVLIGLLTVGAFFLLSEQRAHLFGALPYLLLLACVLMHLFHGHGKHGGGHNAGDLHAPGDPPRSNDAPRSTERGDKES